MTRVTPIRFITPASTSLALAGNSMLKVSMALRRIRFTSAAIALTGASASVNLSAAPAEASNSLRFIT